MSLRDIIDLRRLEAPNDLADTRKPNGHEPRHTTGSTLLISEPAQGYMVPRASVEPIIVGDVKKSSGVYTAQKAWTEQAPKGSQSPCCLSDRR